MDGLTVICCPNSFHWSVNVSVRVETIGANSKSTYDFLFCLFCSSFISAISMFSPSSYVQSDAEVTHHRLQINCLKYVNFLCR